MIEYVFRYPGDPEATFIQMTRAEFQARYRPSEWSITNLETGEKTVGQLDKEDIQCDSCSADPGDTVYVMLYGRGGCRGYCAKCWHELHKKYCTLK